MSKHIAELFQQTINIDLRLDRTNGDWLLKETPQVTVHISSRRSFGFNLDGQSYFYRKVFGHSPPCYVAKICDAIIVLSHKGNDYIFVVEQKTNRTGGAQKQLANGKHFCNWLLALLKEHGHYDGEITFIYLLCWFPRENSPRKGMTSHKKRIGIEDTDLCGLFFEVKNESDVYLLSCIGESE